jgi:hypothetical protein
MKRGYTDDPYGNNNKRSLTHKVHAKEEVERLTKLLISKVFEGEEFTVRLSDESSHAPSDISVHTTATLQLGNDAVQIHEEDVKTNGDERDVQSDISGISSAQSSGIQTTVSSLAARTASAEAINLNNYQLIPETPDEKLPGYSAMGESAENDTTASAEDAADGSAEVSVNEDQEINQLKRDLILAIDKLCEE